MPYGAEVNLLLSLGQQTGPDIAPPMSGLTADPDSEDTEAYVVILDQTDVFEFTAIIGSISNNVGFAYDEKIGTGK